MSSLLEPGNNFVTAWTEYSRCDSMLLPRLNHKNAMDFYLLLLGCSLSDPNSHAMRELRSTLRESTWRGDV